MTQPQSLQWQNEAACQGMLDIFFPDTKEEEEAALQVCGRCPVVYECREYAMESGEKYGVWGGLTDRARRTLRRLYARQPA